VFDFIGPLPPITPLAAISAASGADVTYSLDFPIKMGKMTAGKIF